MDEFLSLLKDYLAQNEKLIQFVSNLQGSEKEYYRENQEILYVGIVNRTYSLWETFCKDIVFEYYKRIKNQLLNRGELVQRLKLNELPGYIVEQGTIADNRISYEITKEYITYTSKNIGFEELKTLFMRFDVKVEELKSNQVIRDFLVDNGFYFDVEDFKNDYLKIAMKKLTDERNVVSHYSSIDEYKELTIIISWIKFYQIIAQELTSLIIRNLIEETDTNPQKLGSFVKYFSDKHLLLIDVSTGVSADSESIIYTKNNNEVKNVYKPISFMVENNEVSSIKEDDKAGIMLNPIIEKNKSIIQNDEIYVISV